MDEFMASISSAGLPLVMMTNKTKTNIQIMIHLGMSLLKLE